MAGALGALLGFGGGVFLVPFLALALGLPFKTAVAISLTTVIATSSSVAAGSAGRQLINLRLGMLLETATAVGGLAGGLTAQIVSDRTLELLFGIVAVALVWMHVAIVRLERKAFPELARADVVPELAGGVKRPTARTGGGGAAGLPRPAVGKSS